jgi:fido (protein-threonine AMPylation protein)
LATNPPKAPDDPGAFGILTPKELRKIEGNLHYLTAKYNKKQRGPNDWSHSLFVEVHRQLFKSTFPDAAGKLRQIEVDFRGAKIPTPAQIPYKLADLATHAREIITHARTIDDEAEQLCYIFEQAARFHAACVMLQPFIDGNKRWARIILNALLNDVDFHPGTQIHSRDRASYLDAIDKAVADEPDQLATLILRGYIALKRVYRSGEY